MVITYEKIVVKQDVKSARMGQKRFTIKSQLSDVSSLTLQTAAFWTGLAIHFPFTLKIFMKCEDGILITVIHA